MSLSELGVVGVVGDVAVVHAEGDILVEERAALAAAHQREVTVLVRGRLPESNSSWAQGGIAAALADDDTPALHLADTLVAGAGLSDSQAVQVLVDEAPMLMRALGKSGVPFDLAGAEFALGLEGGHSRRRIVHVGDATGRAVTEALIARARANPRIRLLEGMQAVELLGEERIKGVLARDGAGQWYRFFADAVVLATGGAGAIYGLTSNQPLALGEGIALAFRAGAEVADMEFMQFHPTVLRTRDGSGFLISEAARGEGGVLRTVEGERFMPLYDARAELAPRDVVTRGIYAALQNSQANHVLLDLTHLDEAALLSHFPTIMARCRAEGIDPAREPIPVAPAAHYLMGGVRTDLDGATSLAGLFAAGECTCTGVHGANRLASNSLLECLVFGRRAGLAASQQAHRQRHKGPLPAPSVVSDQPAEPWRRELAAIMIGGAGPLRDAAGLQQAWQALAEWPLQTDDCSSEAITAANTALVARLIVAAALERRESRGGHFRRDFPQAQATWQQHLVWQRGELPYATAEIATLPQFAHAAD